MDTLARQELTRSLRLQTLVMYSKGRCPAAVTDYLKNNPTHSSRCMRTKSSRGVPSGASFVSTLFTLGQRLT